MAHSHRSKSQKNKKQSALNQSSQKQKGNTSFFQFVDNRTEAIAQQKVKEMVNNHSETKPLPIQKKANKTGLPENLKTGIENFSGYTMDDVKVHYNSSKPAQLQAHAFAQGTDIHLGAGQEKHLPHEAWHVVQQKQGRVKPTLQMKAGVPINDDTGLEKEADVMGAKAQSMSLDPSSTIPLQAKFIASTVAQLRTNAERAALSANFMQHFDRLYIGRITANSTLRDDRTSSITTLHPGTVIIYQGDIRDNFSKGLTSVVKDHVYVAVVSDATRHLIANHAHWRRGWITYETIETDSTGSAALHAAPAAASVGARTEAYLQGFAVGGALPVRLAHRRNLAPKAIKAWAERTQNPLTDTMPLAHLGLVAGDLNNDPAHHYDTIDPTGELALDRVDHASQFFLDAQQFLGLNAAAMPGTMAGDHELRNIRLGGDRARDGQAWLASYAGKNLNDAGIVGITGATVTNIFINRNAPTWAAYEANIQQHLGARGFGAGNANWSPSQTIRGAGNDALIDRMTTGRAGEYYLFHGTSRANVFNISKSGFDPEFVNYTAIKGYGKTGYGTAFTDQYAKALAYAPPERIVAADGSVTYKHYVLVARVFAGRTHQVGDEARRTRGNLEMTQHNINHEEAKGNKMKAQGQGQAFLGQSSRTVADSYAAGTPLHSTVQDRVFDLTLEMEGAEPADPVLQYRDTSLTISDAIQMYPAYIIESSIPAAHMRSGRRA